MEDYKEDSIHEASSDNNIKHELNSLYESTEVHPECLNALAKDIAINIKELCFAISRDGGIPFAEESAQAAASIGESVYKEAVQAGKSFSSAEIEAFKTAIPNKEWNSEETWKITLEQDINQALSDYCLSGTCKRFIK